MYEPTKDSLRKQMRNLYFTEDIRLDYDKKHYFIFQELSEIRKLINTSELMMLFVAIGNEKADIRNEDFTQKQPKNEELLKRARFSGEAKTTFLSVGFDECAKKDNELNLDYLNEKTTFSDIVEARLEAGINYVRENFLEPHEYIQEKDGVEYLVLTEKNEHIFLKEFMTFILGEISVSA